MGYQTSSDPNVFILPDLGEGVHEAEMIAWKVSVGETVKEHQTLAEMETDKALVEVPSPRAGTIKQLHGKEGEILNVGSALVTYEGGAPSDSTPAESAPKAAPHAEERDPLALQQASGHEGNVETRPSQERTDPPRHPPNGDGQPREDHPQASSSPGIA